MVEQQKTFGWGEFASTVQAVLRRFVDTFCSNFQKNGPTDFQKSRKALILGALESYDPGASNGVSNVEI